MHVQIQREGGGVGGPDPIPGKSQVLSNSIEISIWTPPGPLPASPDFFELKTPKANIKKIKAVFSTLGLDAPPPPPPPSLTKKSGSAHALTIQPLTPGLTKCQKELYGYVCTLAELSTHHRGPHGVGGAEINLLVPQKSKICFPGFHVPQHFLCLLVPLKSCTYLLCSLEINAPLPCFRKPMEGLTNNKSTPHPQSSSCSYVFFFPSCSPLFFIFAGIILDGPNPFCEKVLLLLENGL